MDSSFLEPLFLTMRLAMVSTIILLFLCLPLAWILSQWKSRWRYPVEACLTLPLVLPPTVLGFYLLLVLSDDGWLGRFSLSMFGESLSFNFAGLVVGSIVYSLPFVIQPLLSRFKEMGVQPVKTAKVLGMGPLSIFFRVIG